MSITLCIFNTGLIPKPVLVNKGKNIFIKRRKPFHFLIFSQLDAEILGRDAKTVLRGKRKADAEEERQAAARREELEEKFKKWGKG